MSQRTIRRTLLWAAALVVTGVVVFQARGMTPRASETSIPAASPNSPGASRVVAEGRLTTYPGAEVVVGSEVAGRLVALPVEEKQGLRRGDLIAELAADELRAEIAEARAKVAEAEAEIRLAEVESARAERLLEQKVDTVARRDRAQRDLDVARARRTTAEASVGRLEAELAKRRILAPIDGVVIVRHADPGETIEARAPIITIADLGRLRVEAEIDEFDAGRVALGTPVRVTAEGYDDRSWHGTVEEIPDAVAGRKLKPQDPAKPSDTRVLLVKVRLDEPTPLKLGQRVEVSIGG